MSLHSSPPVLALSRVTKRWGESSGLEPVTFDLPAGSVTVVKGRSGSGKSTLLAILAGWCPPDSGEVTRSGDWALNDDQNDEWLRWCRTAVIPQVLANIAELSVRENLEVPLRLGGASTSAVASLVTSTAESLALSELLDRRPGEISVGQQQRLAVGRAVVAAPTLILADEPTSHQDADHAELVLTVLRSAAGSGTAVLIASHDPMVIAIAEQVIDLDS